MFVYFSREERGGGQAENHSGIELVSMVVHLAFIFGGNWVCAGMGGTARPFYFLIAFRT